MGLETVPFPWGAGVSSCGFRCGRYTVSVAGRGHIVLIPLLVEGSGRPKYTDSGAERGEKVYIVYRFREGVGIMNPKESRYHHGFPGSGVARGP
jgi:hypothetical protein